MPFDLPRDSCHRFEQLTGLFPHRLHPRSPVHKQFSGFLHILSFMDALKPKPNLLGYARHTPFQGHRLPLQGFLFRPFDPVFEPPPPFSLQIIPLPGVGSALRLPDLVTSVHHILDDLELVVHHPGVPGVVAHCLV
jgi:hypothetical protein